jgi:hypothetical protein
MQASQHVQENPHQFAYYCSDDSRQILLGVQTIDKEYNYEHKKSTEMM